jgi:AcrR family transcriptional regulator
MAITPRARARAQMISDILNVAQRQLATTGPAELSLRAIARELGMVSSAIYRYMPSKTELLTHLLIAGFNDLGEVAEKTARNSAKLAPAERWVQVTKSIREWALIQPQRWALLFGSPIPGYAAPIATVDPATRLPRVLFTLVLESAATPPEKPRDYPWPSTDILLPIKNQIPPDSLNDVDLIHILRAWSGVIGSISFELFGHRRGVVTDFAEYFTVEQQQVADELGLHRSPAR